MKRGNGKPRQGRNGRHRNRERGEPQSHCTGREEAAKAERGEPQSHCTGGRSEGTKRARGGTQSRGVTAMAVTDEPQSHREKAAA